MHLNARYKRGYIYLGICNGVPSTGWSSSISKYSTQIPPEGLRILWTKQDKLATYHHLSQSHCNLCYVENHTTRVLMMMAIAALNQRQSAAILRSSTFYLEGEEHVIVGSVKPPVPFFLTSLICPFIQWTTPNLIPVSLIHHTGTFSSLSFSMCLSVSGLTAVQISVVTTD